MSTQRDEAGADADGDVVGQRHQDDRQQGRQAVLDVGHVDVLDQREHQVADEDQGRRRGLRRDDARRSATGRSPAGTGRR